MSTSAEPETVEQIAHRGILPYECKRNPQVQKANKVI